MYPLNLCGLVWVISTPLKAGPRSCQGSVPKRLVFCPHVGNKGQILFNCQPNRAEKKNIRDGWTAQIPSEQNFRRENCHNLVSWATSRAVSQRNFDSDRSFGEAIDVPIISSAPNCFCRRLGQNEKYVAWTESSRGERKSVLCHLPCRIERLGITRNQAL